MGKRAFLAQGRARSPQRADGADFLADRWLAAASARRSAERRERRPYLRGRFMAHTAGTPYGVCDSLLTLALSSRGEGKTLVAGIAERPGIASTGRLRTSGRLVYLWRHMVGPGMSTGESHARVVEWQTRQT